MKWLPSCWRVAEVVVHVLMYTESLYSLLCLSITTYVPFLLHKVLCTAYHTAVGRFRAWWYFAVISSLIASAYLSFDKSFPSCALIYDYVDIEEQLTDYSSVEERGKSEGPLLSKPAIIYTIYSRVNWFTSSRINLCSKCNPIGTITKINFKYNSRILSLSIFNTSNTLLIFQM